MPSASRSLPAPGVSFGVTQSDPAAHKAGRKAGGVPSVMR
jgi:hypothetical protein